MDLFRDCYVVREANDGMALGVGEPRTFKIRKKPSNRQLMIDREALLNLKKKCDRISVDRWGTWKISKLPANRRDACNILKGMVTESEEPRFPEFNEEGFRFEDTEKLLPLFSRVGYYEGIASTPSRLSIIIDGLLAGNVSAYDELMAYDNSDELKTYQERIGEIQRQINICSDDNKRELLASAKAHKDRASLFLKMSHLEAEAEFNPKDSTQELRDIYNAVKLAVDCFSKEPAPQFAKRK